MTSFAVVCNRVWEAGRDFNEMIDAFVAVCYYLLVEQETPSMPHPIHDPRTVSSTQGDIQSITTRYSDPASIARILRQRETLARASSARPEIIAMYRSELNHMLSLETI